MSARLTISIAMTTYNGESFVRAQLDSIACQTRLPDELVIFDDTSTDTTVSIVMDFARHALFPVRLQANPERLGSILNYEAAIQACSGEIIFLCDQDDTWHPDKLARIEEQFICKPETNAVFTDADVVDQANNSLGFRLWEGIRFSSREQAQLACDATPVLLKHPVVTGATMAFRSTYRNLVLPIPNVWAHDAWISILIGTVSHLTALSIPLVAYRQHSNNQTGVRQRANKHRKKSLIAVHGEKLLFFELVRARLLKFSDSLPITEKQMFCLDEKIAFLRARAMLPATRWRRLTPVLHELIALRYHRYAMGWESFGSDLLHKEKI